jgi:[ribosomal protein S5]-alanine N-acetyltransferase
MVPLRTIRLELVPLSLEELLRWVSGQRADDDPHPPSSVHGDAQASLELSLALCRDDPSRHAWHAPWKIHRISDGRSLGMLSFSQPPKRDEDVVLAYWMDTRYQNQGYMTEALEAVCRWAFRDKQLRHLVASTEATNRASRRVLEKTGFMRDGLWKENPRWVRQRSRSVSRSASRVLRRETAK